VPGTPVAHLLLASPGRRHARAMHGSPELLEECRIPGDAFV
jgi:hypothetical protein